MRIISFRAPNLETSFKSWQRTLKLEAFLFSQMSNGKEKTSTLESSFGNFSMPRPQASMEFRWKTLVKLGRLCKALLRAENGD